MTPQYRPSYPQPGDGLARCAFVASIGFLAVAGGLGALLRWSWISPPPRFDYAHWLHAHSHTAFLGFVFNAFFSFALQRFVPAEGRAGYGRLFLLLQAGVLGMLATFPIQGYGPASIAFSTLHMVTAGIFAWRLWHGNVAEPAARAHLRVALACLVLSGLGPLLLGPLAAQGLHDTPAYRLCIYFYLHAQYNGWFPFFLQALLLQSLTGQSLSAEKTRRALRACRWLGAGVVLTFAQSTLWLGPPAWVKGIAALGGLAQIVGFAFFVQALRGGGVFGEGTPLARCLGWLAFAAWGLKLGLQVAAASPGLAALVNHRFIVIAFLHLVFLGAVTPMILAFGLRAGWLRETLPTRLAIGIFFAASLLSEVLLIALALGFAPPISLPWLLFVPAAFMAAAAFVLFGAGAFYRPALRPALFP